MSSNNFVEVKSKEKEDKRRLKWRLVPQGKKDSERRAFPDAITEKFRIIRFLLAHAVIHGEHIVFVDTKRAFLHASGFSS